MPKRFDLVEVFHERLIALYNASDGATHLINGWFSRESQEIRFAALLNSARYCSGRIADYGCGTGDLFGYLQTHFPQAVYRGYDFNTHMLEIARSRFGSDFFEEIAFDSTDIGNHDYILASGIFQFLDADRPMYYIDILRRLLDRCNTAIAVNFLSSNRSAGNKVANELYLSDQQVLRTARQLSRRWGIDHSYHAGYADITLAMFKDCQSTWKRPDGGPCEDMT
jgi:SAM-dependent methyltransferase